ncbi:MAG: hypothetical protein ABTA24_02150 [Arthrobacter sp.]
MEERLVGRAGLASSIGSNGVSGAQRTSGELQLERAADAAADAWLLRSVGAGAVLALLYQLGGSEGFVPAWEPLNLWWILPGELYPLHVILPGLLPGFLVFVAYLFVARMESRLNLRRQRGALAILVFTAVFLGLVMGSMAFSGVYGAALLALAVRTRETLTVMTGVMALAASVACAVVYPSWAVLPVLGLTAGAAFIAARRLGRKATRLLAAV